MTRWITPALAWWVSSLFGLAPPAAAQKVPELKLTTPDARYGQALSSIRGFRALPDGSVLVSDGIDETLLRLNPQLRRADTISRAGQGPGEYKGPDTLYPVENGGTLLVDLGNARLSFFDAALKYRESVPMVQGQPGTGLTMTIPRGTDAQGRIYLQPGPAPGAPQQDSGAVVRLDRARNQSDTIAWVGLPARKVTTSGGANNRSVSVRAVPLAPQDAWAVAPDGRVAIARVVDYHVEWVHPGGRVVRGPPNPFSPVPVKAADKKEWLDQLSDAVGVMVTSANGRMNVQLARGAGRARDPDPSQYEWPATKPPFPSNGVSISAEGDAWVQRSAAAGAAPAYDVFGPNATVTRRVVLPSGRRVIGFGPGVVYAQHTDPDDGLHYLERYRLP